MPSFNRLDVRADAFSSSYLDSVTSDGFYAQPMTAPNADAFSFTSRWRLQQPMLGLRAGKEPLDLIVLPGSTLHDATFKTVRGRRRNRHRRGVRLGEGGGQGRRRDALE